MSALLFPVVGTTHREGRLLDNDADSEVPPEFESLVLSPIVGSTRPVRRQDTLRWLGIIAGFKVPPD